MPAPSTAEQFLKLVNKSALLDPGRLEEYVQQQQVAGSLPGTPDELAAAMVRDGLLTRFQAEQLLQGRHRNFILSGKYKILRPLGAGGMGHVFLCEHSVMHRRVAVKLLPPNLASDPDAVERFHREVRAVARLHHPNIVTAHDADRDGPRPFLVMEFIDGRTLHLLVKADGAVPPARAAHYISQAALGLQHAHEHGLVHRDIKPHNLVVDRQDTVKVLDLGLARFFHDESDDLSRRNDSSPLGTTDYMAPEQAVDSHTADIRADIYSLGATFYFLLVGHSPFHGMTTMEKILAHQTRQPQPIREIRPEVPEGMAKVLERMMAKDPARRYQTPRQVAEALAPLTPEAPPRARNEGAEPDPRPEYVVSVEEGATPFAPASTEATFAPTGEVTDTVRTPRQRRAKVLSKWQQPGGRAGRDRAVIVGGAALLVLGMAVGLALWLLGPSDSGARNEAGIPPGPPLSAAVPPLRLLVPAYFYPGGEGLAEWERLLNAPTPAEVVIIANADSGPGKIADPNLSRVIHQAREKGFTVIGYVSTRYAKRLPEEVREDVDRWVRLYPGVQGVFFDEQASAADRVDYYAALYEYARKQRGLPLVVSNPGTTCAQEYLARPTADVVCLIESGKEFKEYRPPPWVGDYPAGRFAAMVCKVGDAVLMKEYVAKMADKHVGTCYLTDHQPPNPWDRLPSYWEAELTAVRQANERGGQEGSPSNRRGKGGQ